jgi:hypothetical protein
VILRKLDVMAADDQNATGGLTGDARVANTTPPATPGNAASPVGVARWTG